MGCYRLNIKTIAWSDPILFEDFLSVDTRDPEIELFRKHERTGRALGTDSFIGRMEDLLGRKLKPQKPGPKKRDK